MLVSFIRTTTLERESNMGKVRAMSGPAAERQGLQRVMSTSGFTQELIF